VRWWNVKHPHAYSTRLAEGISPGAGRELLTPGEQRVEEIMLRLRLAEGVPIDLLDTRGRAALHQAAADGLVTVVDNRAVLTIGGRLLADAVIRDLI
jgi:oxygen-independent coproporphyrinogen-3 oxidase